MMRAVLLRLAVGVSIASGAMMAAAAVASAATPNYPVNWSAATALVSGAALNVPPPGADLSHCSPSPEHPDPVVLVHGVFQNQNMAWQALAPILANDGYCVYTLTYGQVWYSGNLGGIDELSASAAELNTFVAHVLAS